MMRRRTSRAPTAPRARPSSTSSTPPWGSPTTGSLTTAARSATACPRRGATCARRSTRCWRGSRCPRGARASAGAQCAPPAWCIVCVCVCGCVCGCVSCRVRCAAYRRKAAAAAVAIGAPGRLDACGPRAPTHRCPKTLPPPHHPHPLNHQPPAATSSGTPAASPSGTARSRSRSKLRDGSR